MDVNLFVSAVVSYENKIILVQEGKKAVYGKWNLPGGHLEPEEGIVQGILREIMEETGLSVELDDLPGIFTDLAEVRHIVFVFRGRAKSLAFQPQVEDIITCRWFTLEELSQLENDQILNPVKFRKILQYHADGRGLPLEHFHERIFPEQRKHQ
jgi:ADP-ribose pyrophosphatase YjhB (NUDIX family)